MLIININNINVILHIKNSFIFTKIINKIINKKVTK